MQNALLRNLGLGLLMGMLLGAFTSAHADSAPLRRVGVGLDGETIDEEVDADAYAKDFHAIVSSVSDSSLAALNRPGVETPWKLQTLVIGVGVGMEFGLGPILKVKATPRMRVVFSKNDDPVLP